MIGEPYPPAAIVICPDCRTAIRLWSQQPRPSLLARLRQWWR